MLSYRQAISSKQRSEKMMQMVRAGMFILFDYFLHCRSLHLLQYIYFTLFPFAFTLVLPINIMFFVLFF